MYGDRVHREHKEKNTSMLKMNSLKVDFLLFHLMILNVTKFKIE